MNLLRESLHKITCRHSDAECFNEFIHKMNEKATRIGMSHTKWINPSGLGEEGSYSVSSARDLTLMAIYAYHHPVLNEIWNKKEYVICIRKPFIFQRQRIKNKVILSTIPFERLAGKYRILGAKTGSGDGYQTLIMICEICNRVVAGTVMNANTDEDRFTAMAELMSIADNMLAGSTDLTTSSVNSAKNACAYLVEGDKPEKCLYEKNADKISAPMSATKVMTLLTALDYLSDVSKMAYIIPSDFIRGDSDILNPWEKVSIQDIMHAAMLPSSNVAANALARIAGTYMMCD